MMSNKISVVIPVYNGELFIARAITSVLNQSAKPYELIVVNDGSKDRTGEILATYGDTIKVVSIANGGVANARNVGIKDCTGDYIAFLDADDIWYEDKLKLQLDVFERYPEVGFTCCNYTVYNKHLKLIVNHFSILEKEEGIVYDQPLAISALEVLLKYNFVGTCSNVIIKREVINQVGMFNASYKQAEDYDLWLRCALVTKFALQSEVMLEKKTHDANLTNDIIETLLFHEKVLINFQLDNQTKPQIHNIKDKFLSALVIVRYKIGNLFYEKNLKVKAFQYHFLGLFTSPTLANFKIFFILFSKKLLRTVSLGLIKRREV